MIKTSSTGHTGFIHVNALRADTDAQTHHRQKVIQETSHMLARFKILRI